MKKANRSPGVVRTAIRQLAAGEQTFRDIPRQTLEDTLSWYMKLLLLSGLVAGVFSFIRSAAWAYYLHIFKGVAVDVPRLLNYAFGISTGTFFVYLFVGTFGVFIVSVVLWVALRKRLRLTQMVMACAYAMTPVYLIGWVDSTLAFVLLVWSAFLLLTGLAALRRPQRA